MRILVAPHAMDVGGSQLNAIDLAAAVRDRGHDVVVFGPPGPLVERVRDSGLRFVPAPPPGRRPDRRVMAAMCALVREDRIDVVHGYEWPPALEAFCGPHRTAGTAVVATVLSMAVAPFLPASLPLVVGTRQLAEQNAAGRDLITCIPPPVDLAAEDEPVDAGGLRAAWGVPDDGLLVVVVTRLAAELKLEGLLDLTRAAPHLADEHGATVVVVGDGPARAQVAAAAAQANAGRDRPAVVLAGAMADPRPAYRAADVVVGMGSSALRALAHRKPLVVQGEGGFWRRLEPSSVGLFDRQGWYGTGAGEDGAAAVRRELEPLLRDARLRRELGDFGRAVVERGYSLTAAAGTLEELYDQVLRQPARPAPGEAARAAGRAHVHQLRRRLTRVVRPVPADDFNARRVLPAPAVGTGR